MSAVRGCACADPYRLGSKHKCTPGRPLCRRTDSKRNQTCYCGGHHFPHRLGSGTCMANPRAQERLNELVHGPEAECPF